MITETIKAFFMASIPVGIFSFLLMGWAYKLGKLKEFATQEELKNQLDEIKEEKKKKQEKGEKDDHGDFILNKWLSFGGGFYGTMAFFTYVVIEVQEIWDFITNLNKIANLFSNLGLDLLIQFILNSIYNFVAAIIWFITWGREIDDHAIIWLVMAYAGYVMGSKMVPKYSHHVWPALAKLRDNTNEAARSNWQKIRPKQHNKETPEQSKNDEQP